MPGFVPLGGMDATVVVSGASDAVRKMVVVMYEGSGGGVATMIVPARVPTGGIVEMAEGPLIVPDPEYWTEDVTKMAAWVAMMKVPGAVPEGPTVDIAVGPVIGTVPW